MMAVVTKPPTLGACMLKRPHGNVYEPTAWIFELDSVISTGIVSSFVVPCIVTSPLTSTSTTPPLYAFLASRTGRGSLNDAFGLVAL